MDTRSPRKIVSRLGRQAVDALDLGDYTWHTQAKARLDDVPADVTHLIVLYRRGARGTEVHLVTEHEHLDLAVLVGFEDTFAKLTRRAVLLRRLGEKRLGELSWLKRLRARKLIGWRSSTMALVVSQYGEFSLLQLVVLHGIAKDIRDGKVAAALSDNIRARFDKARQGVAHVVRLEVTPERIVTPW